MSATAVFEERVDPGRVSSAALAALVHFALLALLVFGVSWQNRPPQTISAEVWVEPVPAPAEPKPLPKVEPPREETKPEPVIAKPDIAVKKVPEKTKPVIKPEPPKPKPRIDDQKRIREELAREQAAFAQERERQQIRDQLAKDASMARNRGLVSWMDKMRNQIRSRIRVEVAQAVPGNPEAVFDVTLLPTGEVLNFQKRKSSGHQAYDDELERALSYFKNSPLPKPDRPELFSRELRLTFRPKDL